MYKVSIIIDNEHVTNVTETGSANDKLTDEQKITIRQIADHLYEIAGVSALSVQFAEQV